MEDERISVAAGRAAAVHRNRASGCTASGTSGTGIGGGCRRRRGDRDRRVWAGGAARQDAPRRANRPRRGRSRSERPGTADQEDDHPPETDDDALAARQRWHDRRDGRRRGAARLHHLQQTGAGAVSQFKVQTHVRVRLCRDRRLVGSHPLERKVPHVYRAETRRRCGGAGLSVAKQHSADRLHGHGKNADGRLGSDQHCFRCCEIFGN